MIVRLKPDTTDGDRLITVVSAFRRTFTERTAVAPVAREAATRPRDSLAPAEDLQAAPPLVRASPQAMRPARTRA